jgi:hypothetical protein
MNTRVPGAVTGRPLASRGRTRHPGERRLVDVVDRVKFRRPNDVLGVLPTLTSEPCSTRGLASLLGRRMLLAQRTAYCLRMINIVEPVGKRGRTPLHRRTAEAALPT